VDHSFYNCLLLVLLLLLHLCLFLPQHKGQAATFLSCSPTRGEGKPLPTDLDDERDLAQV
jgi:hypothetical protein